MRKKQMIILLIGGFLLLFCNSIFAQENREARDDKNIERFEQVITLLQNEKLADNERAELLFEKATLMFETFGPLYLRTATESLLKAIRLEPGNTRYKSYLNEVYNEFWKDKDLSESDKISVDLRALRDEVKKRIDIN